MIPDLSPSQAWEPLPDSAFDRAAAAHLLRRAGFSATPSAVADSLERGLAGTVRQLFGGNANFVRPLAVTEFGARVTEDAPRVRALRGEDRREERNAFRRESQTLTRQFAVAWHRHALNPAHSAVEKWVTFLHDVFVVGAPKVYDVTLLADHQELLRRGRFAPYRDLCRAVSRSPGMVEFLDLQRSRATRPNENFARELFELFMLGEGNYSEQDIKEAARAFTGYRRDVHRFAFMDRQHDGGRKTVFGKSGTWGGDDVIDLALQQPGAATFLPREMARFYLDPECVPSEAQLQSLGAIWRSADFSLATLAQRFFTSRYFFHPSLRARQIKSPTQFYLGLLQDLHLDLPPFPGQLVTHLRLMGQAFFAPPNVRGWVGGRNWINSATVAARRQVINYHFTPLNEETLNADDLQELLLARAEGLDNLIFTPERIEGLAAKSDDELLATCFEYLLAEPPAAEVRAVYRRHLGGRRRNELVRELLMALLESPSYHLC